MMIILIHVSSIVTYRRKKCDGLCVNMAKHCSESTTRCCYWSIVSERGTHFKKSFLMVTLLPSDIFSYLTQFQLTIRYNQFVNFFDVFWSDHINWTTRTFTIIGVCMTTFKFSKPITNSSFRWSRVRITLLKPLLSLYSIFSSRINDKLTHEIVLKITKIASLKWLSLFTN